MARSVLLPLLALGASACTDAPPPPGGPVDVGFFDGGPGGDGCPPSGAFGVEEGELLPDPSLVDCDGNPYSLQGLCGKKAAWQFHLAGW